MSRLRLFPARLRASGFARGAAKLGTGAALAQLVGISATPVLTRLYGPENYGLAASFIAIVGILGPSAALRYDLAIVRADSEDDAARLVELSLVLAAAVAVAAAVAATAAWLLAPGLAGHRLGWLVLLVPPAAAGTAAAAIAGAWANRHARYGVLAATRLATAAAAPLVSLAAFAAAGSTAAGLVLGAVAGPLAGAGLSLWLLRRTRAPLPAPVLARGRWGGVAGRFRQFPRFNLPMTVLEQATVALPVLVFAAAFSPEAAAWFALASSVLRLPAGLVGQAVGQVFYERASRLHASRAELALLLRRMVMGTAPLAALMLLVLVPFAPALFAAAFGAEWREAGEYARWISLAAALTLVTSPISTLPSVLDRQHVHLTISLVAYAARAGAIVAGMAAGSPVLAVALYSVGEAVVNLAFLGWLWRLAAAPAPPVAGA